MRDQIIATARSYIGTKWRHRGRTQRGMDCVGLVVLSCQSAGIEIEDYVGYGREPWNDRLRQELKQQFGNPTDDWQPGDIALFEIEHQRPRHIGILGNYKYGGLSLIHAHSIYGVVEQSLAGTKDLNLVEVYPCHR